RLEGGGRDALAGAAERHLGVGELAPIGEFPVRLLVPVGDLELGFQRLDHASDPMCDSVTYQVGDGPGTDQGRTNTRLARKVGPPAEGDGGPAALRWRLNFDAGASGHAVSDPRSAPDPGRRTRAEPRTVA